MSDEAHADGEVRNAVRRLARTAGARMVRRPFARNRPSLGMFEEPEPLAGITAAVRVAAEARWTAGYFAGRAREDGRSWEEIGAALGCQAGPDGLTVAEEGFRRFAGGPGSCRAPWFSWTCPDCAQAVTDYGPEMGHPEEAEEGHAPGCERLAAQVTAWNARWGDGQ